MTQQEIFTHYRRLRLRRIGWSVVAGAILLILLALGVRTMALGVRAAVVVVMGGGLMAFLSRDWRCPKCHQRLGRLIGGEACPHCGVPLTPNEAEKQAAKRADSAPRS